MAERRPGPADLGTTLVELAVVMIVLALVAGLSVQVVISMARNLAATSSFADSVARIRLALGSMERQVRSGDVLFSPVTESSLNAACQAYGTSSGSCMRVYTQVDGARRCVQWQIAADPAAPTTAVLKTRSFSPSWNIDGDVGPGGQSSAACSCRQPRPRPSPCKADPLRTARGSWRSP
jgi:type II secretory pathway pseudopilin PulG